MFVTHDHSLQNHKLPTEILRKAIISMKVRECRKEEKVSKRRVSKEYQSGIKKNINYSVGHKSASP